MNSLIQWSSQVELAYRAQSRLPTTLIYLMILLDLSYLSHNRANQTFRAKLLHAPSGLTLATLLAIIIKYQNNVAIHTTSILYTNITTY